MRSLTYLAALLPLASLTSVLASPEKDVIVLVTSTRTVTICPLTELVTCPGDIPTIPPGGGGGHGGGGWPATTTSPNPDNGSGGTTSGGSGGWGDHSTVSTSYSSGSWGSSSSFHYGNSSTTSFSGSLTTTSATTTSASNSTTTSCGTATETAKGLDLPQCNTANDRSRWCHGKSVDTDTHNVFYSGNTKRYTLTITSQNIDFDGTPKPAFAINGKSPGEPIIANWGDNVEITVVNGLTDNATTIHWHGIRQTGSNDQDGVPGVTECGIAPGSSRVYKWHASTYGTGWYHSHALAQFGGGLRGPIIIHGPATADYDLDLGTVMVDETFGQTIFQMAYNIARVRGALPPSTNYLLNGKNVDPTDATKGEAAKWVVKKGKKHLFRIINSSAQTAFAVHFDNHKLKVISADFTPIVPYETDTLFIQGGQRYNVIVEANQPEGAYYLRAIAQTGCGSTSVNTGLGTANGIFSYEGSCATPTAGNFTLVTAGDCKDEPLASLIPHVSKGAGSTSQFQSHVQLLPGGNAGSQVFDGYGSVIRWFFGGLASLSGNSVDVRASKGINVTYEEPTLKTLATLPDLAYNSSLYSNSAVLDGPANSWVYFVIQNNFQTSHPMHLHGHDFSVLGQGRGVFTQDMVGQLNFQNPIRRDTALLFGLGSPTQFVSGWTVIGFETDNPGAWVMHCHLIWHADGGMGLQFLERPDEINAGKYYNTAAFKDECSAYESYIANGGHVKHSYEAGIKRHLDSFHYHGHAGRSLVRGY